MWVRGIDETHADAVPVTHDSRRGITTYLAGRRWIATFVDDRDPGSTWLYDHTTGEARPLFRADHVDRADLAR